LGKIKKQVLKENPPPGELRQSTTFTEGERLPFTEKRNRHTYYLLVIKLLKRMTPKMEGCNLSV
jgi:hypothetical protein